MFSLLSWLLNMEIKVLLLLLLLSDDGCLEWLVDIRGWQTEELLDKLKLLLLLLLLIESILIVRS